MTAPPLQLPLLGARDPAAPLAWRFGQPISAAQFVGEALLLAERLPARGRPLNLCQDRVHFALGLAAALLRGQTSVLPPNALPETLRQVPQAGEPPYLLSDDPALDTCGLPLVWVERPAGARPVTSVSTVAADLDAVCLLTSGSTGAPQPHAKRWGQLVANIDAEAARLAELIGRFPAVGLAGLTLVATVPPQHSYGLESSVLLALLGGASLDACRPFYPADIVKALDAVPRPRALVITPFHLKTLLLAGLSLPPVDLVLSATAPLSPQLAAQAEAAFGGPLVEIYGCTEAGQVATRRTTAGDAWTTLGALRITPATGPDGDTFSVVGGHVTEPTPLADVLQILDAPSGAPAGAAARRFRLLGRANDLIHVAGKRSSLAHLNFHLNRIDGVDDGAFWLPDDVTESVVRPVAFVVAPRLDARTVIAALRRHLEPAFVPRRVLLVDALPREATGKLTVAALRRFALARLAAPAAATVALARLATPAAATVALARLAKPAAATVALARLAKPAASAVAPAAPADALFTVAADHPAFAGHFPGRPLLPGVVLLSLVLQALARQPALQALVGTAPCIANAKFLAPVGPGAALRVALRAQGTGVAFEVSADLLAVARGQLAAQSAAQPG